MSINSENSLIGALLRDPQALYRITDPLKPQDFQIPENHKAYATICRMLKSGDGIDPITVAEAGGGELAYLSGLASNTPGSYNIDSYAKAVKQTARKRQLTLTLKNGLTQIESGQPINEIKQSMMAAIESDIQRTNKPFKEIVADTLGQAEDTAKARSSGHMLGIPTCLPILNRITGGFHGPKLVVLGGRPGTFKTAYALQVVTRAASQGHPVGFVSLEMGADELVTRAIANQLGLNGSDLSHGDQQALTMAQTARDWDWPLFIEDRAFNWPDIVSCIIGWRHQQKIELAVIDYLQIIQIPGKGSRFEKLGEVSRDCKLLAKRLGIPILLLTQISRDVEKDNRRPLLSDIRECGNVEQDADLVLFTHCRHQKDRPDQYELIVAKQRNGAARKVIWLNVDGARYLIGEQYEQDAY